MTTPSSSGFTDGAYGHLPTTPAEELRAAAVKLRGYRPPGTTPRLDVEYPDLDAAYASLLEAHALRFEHAPETVSDEGRRALAMARAILGGPS